MFDPHAHIFDAVLKAIFAATLVAMAGGFPCCCSEADGSTTTSTGSSRPPVPRPGSTSTSSRYVVPRFACQWCIDSASVASQYVVEVAGFADSFCDCDALNAVYFIETLSDGGYSSAVFFLTSGCGINMNDALDFTCLIDEISGDPEIVNVNIGFVAAGNDAGSSPLQWSKTFFGMDLHPVNPIFTAHAYEFATYWAGPQADATETVPCDTIEGVALPYYTEAPFDSICIATGATATPFEFTGF